MDDPLSRFRDRFPILEHTTYLASHTLGPMPRKAAERLAEFARMWAERGIRSWAEGWWATPMRVGDQIGRIIGAPPGSTVMHQNVAIAKATRRCASYTGAAQTSIGTRRSGRRISMSAVWDRSPFNAWAMGWRSGGYGVSVPATYAW